jgi:protein-tyrosine phosphatase
MDLREADLVVALKEEEHRPLFEERFPAWTERVEYWHVHDLDRATASDGLAEIERQIEALLRRLGAEQQVQGRKDKRWKIRKPSS